MDFIIRQLLRSIGTVFRSCRAIIARYIANFTARFRQMTNFSRHAARAATGAIQSATKVAKTPSKREDYIAFGNLLIAKAFLVRLILMVGILGFLAVNFLWPWFLSRFLTARFWVEDKRVPDWTGRVIVYADKQKKEPLYSGRLEDGKLQGQGREYDDEGLVSYEGTFLDGLRSGTGAAYVGGVLYYEGQYGEGYYEGQGTLYDQGETHYTGQFSRGVFHGTGILYEDGNILYDGQFDRGIYQGKGKLYQAGKLSYDGSFEAGVPEGMGTSYYYGGGTKYQGQFVEGVPDGTGKAYEDGRMVYQGGFAKGAYEGQGTLYPVPGEQIAAEFAAGVPQGVVRWSKEGKLYYEGEWAENRPNGYGTLYAKSGTPLYKGAFIGGTIDGGSLLGLGVDDLRKALGEDNTRSTAGQDRTFTVTSSQLGLAAKCTYQTDSAPSQVAAVYLYQPQEGDGWFRLLPGMDDIPNPAGDAQRGTLSYIRQDGVPLASGQYGSSRYTLEGGTETVVFQRQVPVLVWWNGTGSSSGTFTEDTGADSGGAAGTDTAPDTAAALAAGVTGMEAVEELLAALDGMDAAPAAPEPEAFGTGPVGDAIAGCGSIDAASALVSALSDAWLQTETENLLADNLSRTQLLLEDARKQAAMGQGSQDAVAALEKEQQAIEEQIVACQLQKKQAALAAQEAAPDVADPMALDLTESSVLFDPSQLDVSELAPTAAAFAQATGKNAEGVEVAVKSALLNLQDRYNAAQAAVKQYEAAAKAADSAAAQYAMGTGEKSAWYQALTNKNNVRTALYSSMNAFTRQAADLNAATGGWVSRTAGWFGAEFETVLQTQFPEGLPEPETGETPDSGGVTENSGTTGSGGVTENSGTAGSGGATENGGTAENGGATGNNSGNSESGGVTENSGTAGSSGTAGNSGTAGSGGTSGTDTSKQEDTSGSGTGASGTGNGTGTSGTGNGTGTASGTGSGTSTAAGQTDKADSPYPDWYDPDKEPPENEPGIPLPEKPVQAWEAGSADLALSPEEWDAAWGVPET